MKENNISTIAPFNYEDVATGNTVFVCKPMMARKVRTQLSKRGYNFSLVTNPESFKDSLHFLTNLKWIDFVGMMPEHNGYTKDQLKEAADKIGVVANF